jgi:hypothetical protein
MPAPSLPTLADDSGAQRNRHDRVPDELLTVPPFVSGTLRISAKTSECARRTISGSLVALVAADPTMSAKSTVAILRSPDMAGSLKALGYRTPLE